jgi:hypothetical protein
MKITRRIKESFEFLCVSVVNDFVASNLAWVRFVFLVMLTRLPDNQNFANIVASEKEFYRGKVAEERLDMAVIEDAL